MEKKIKEAATLITGGEEPSDLTQCAIAIATLALSSFRDTLRDKALNVAKAIADYEDELLTMGKHSK